MPLGNGDIGLNVWVQQDGDLLFFVGKTDAWSEVVRLLKLGRVRVKLSPNPFAKGLPFRQELRLRQGEIEIRAGRPDEEVTLRLWVDANRPVIHLEGCASRPFRVQVSFEAWRSSEHVFTARDFHSAYGMDGVPHPVVESADVVLADRKERIVWYHRNPTSIWEETLTLQGLNGLRKSAADPLRYRTFGGVIQGSGLINDGDGTLKSDQPSRRHHVAICVHTAQTPTAEAWVARADELLTESGRAGLEPARQAHRAWWAAFWDGSRVRVSIPNAEAATHPRVLVENAPGDFPLRIGCDRNGGSCFQGEMDDIRIYTRALTLEEIAAHAQRKETRSGPDPSLAARWTFEKIVRGAAPNVAGKSCAARLVGNARLVDGPDGKCLRLDGDGYAEVAHDPALDLRQAGTIEAWICPRKPGLLRIVDKIACAPGGLCQGYLLDGGLRAIFRLGILGANANLRPGQWTHVAVTFDIHAGVRLFADGKIVGDFPAGTYTPDGELISQRYALQRFMFACAGRGGSPIKFNGSIFNVDGPRNDADFRAWGGPYWFQNTRLAYWPLLACGDFQMMRPLFRMYQAALPLAMERTRRYFKHEGAFFPETMYFFGAYANSDYGWNRNGKGLANMGAGAHAGYLTGNLELLALMLDYYAYTADQAFAKQTLLPMAEPLLLFWDKHFPRDAKGRLQIGGQALECYSVTNPLPDVAGLHWVLDSLLALPEGLVGSPLRQQWERLRGELPPLPMVEVQNQRRLAVGQGRLPGGGNVYENPELYAIFPFRLYGVGKPELELARHTFAKRYLMGNWGWQQDDIQAAMLGLTDTVAQLVTERLANTNPGCRFPAMWGPNADWLPDQDHGGVAMRALQAMLLQDCGDKLLVLPAWPKEWDVDFKLYAPQQTVVECRYRSGRVERLTVIPAAREKDVVVMIRHQP